MTLQRRRRRPAQRFIVISVAIATLVVGYYLGQYWQRRPLSDISATLYDGKQHLQIPERLAAPSDSDGHGWRLYIVADTGAEACRQLLRSYALMFNHLAVHPKIQSDLKVVVLAYDHPDADAETAFTGGVTWAELLIGDPDAMDQVTTQLGLSTLGLARCSLGNDDAVLVGPDNAIWALIPHEEPDIMARNLNTIIDFVE